MRRALRHVSELVFLLRNAARIPHSSGKICSTLREQPSRQKSSRKTKITSPISPLTPYFDSRYALAGSRPTQVSHVFVF